MDFYGHIRFHSEFRDYFEAAASFLGNPLSFLFWLVPYGWGMVAYHLLRRHFSNMLRWLLGILLLPWFGMALLSCLWRSGQITVKMQTTMLLIGVVVFVLQALAWVYALIRSRKAFTLQSAWMFVALLVSIIMALITFGGFYYKWDEARSFAESSRQRQMDVQKRLDDVDFNLYPGAEYPDGMPPMNPWFDDSTGHYVYMRFMTSDSADEVFGFYRGWAEASGMRIYEVPSDFMHDPVLLVVRDDRMAVKIEIQQTFQGYNYLATVYWDTPEGFLESMGFPDAGSQ
jgi:hypothetical protein